MKEKHMSKDKRTLGDNINDKYDMLEHAKEMLKLGWWRKLSGYDSENEDFQLMSLALDEFIERRENNRIIWEDKRIQFPRLICELQMSGALTDEIMDLLKESMDLEEEEINELINMAEDDWSLIKNTTIPPASAS